MSWVPWQAWAGLFGLAGAGLFWWWLTRALKTQGELQQRAAAAEKETAHAKDANAIREDVARLSDNDLQRELRGH